MDEKMEAEKAMFDRAAKKAAAERETQRLNEYAMKTQHLVPVHDSPHFNPLANDWPFGND